MEKHHYTNILIFIVICIIGYSIFFDKTPRTNVEQYNQKIEILQRSIDSISKVNKSLDNKLILLNERVAVIDSSIKKTENNINVIKRNTNEKINNVDRFTISQLQQFFAERYNSNPTGTSSETGD